MATLRRCTGTPVTSVPSTSDAALRRPSRPAIRRISEVLPAQRRAEQHVQRAALERQRDVADMGLGADLLAHVVEDEAHPRAST